MTKQTEARYKINRRPGVNLWGRPKTSSNSTAQVKLTDVKVRSLDSNFAVVGYSVNGKKQPYDLRLDLDKQVFLDKTGFQAADRALTKVAPHVVRRIGMEISGNIAGRKQAPASSISENSVSFRLGQKLANRSSSLKGKF